MSTIDIKKNYKQFSPSELRSYAYSGHLTCGNTDLSDFLEYIFTDYKVEASEEEVEAIKDEAYNRGWSDAKHEAICAVQCI